MVKLSTTGSRLAYSTYRGGRRDEDAADVGVGGSGATYVTGSTYSQDFPTTAGALDRRRGLGDAYFVAEFTLGTAR